MNTNTVRILTVEDNPADFRLLTEYLGENSSMDFDIVHAETLKDTLGLIPGGKFDIIVLDLNLPDSRGLEGLEKINDIRQRPPVIVLTGLDSEETGLQAMSRNAQDYLVKGKINGDMLIRSIRYSIERHRADEITRLLNAELTITNRALDESRRAALNLVDDAIEARRLVEESERRFKGLFEGAAEGILVTDAETRSFLYANRAILDLFGYTLDEMTGLTVSDLHPVDSLPRVIDAFESMKASALNNTGDVPCLRRDGTNFYADIHSTKMEIDGRFCLVGYFTDTTERRKAAEALRESEERFRILTTSTPDHILVQDMDLRYTYVLNPQLGLTEKEMIGRTDFDILTREDAENITKIKKRVLETGKAEEVSAPLVSSAGEINYFDGTYLPRRNADGAIDGILGYFKNVTERVKMEEALKESEKKFRELVLFAPTGIWEVDFRTKKFVTVNDSMCLLTGYTREEFLNMTPLEILDEEGKSAFLARIGKWLKGEKLDDNIEYRVRAKDGHIIYALLNVNFNIDEQGNPIGAMVVGHDITERKKVEIELANRAAELEAVFSAQTDAVLVYDTGTNVRRVNPSFKEVYGFDPVGLNVREMIERTSLRSLDGRQLTLEEQPTPRALRGERVSHAYFTIKRSDGSEAVLDTSSGPMRLGDTVIGAVTVWHDITERTRAEEALRNMALFPEENPSPVMRIACDGTLLFANQASGALLDEWKCGVGSALPGHIWQARAGINECGVRREMEIQCTGRDFIFNIVPIEERQYINLYGRDITERRRAEEVLRELTQRLTYHVDNSPLAVIEWGPDMRLSRWSGEAERIFGWKAEEVLGKKMEDFRWVYDEDMPTVEEVSSELVDGTNPRRFSTNRNYRKDGSVAHCEWYNSSLVDEKGNLRSIMSLVLDVTERKRAEQALVDSERKHRLLIDLMTEGFALTEIMHDETGRPADYRFHEVNRAWENMTGIPADEAAGKTVRQLFRDMDPLLLDIYGNVAATGEAVHYEQYDAGIGRFYDINSYAVGGNLVAHTYHDITERKRAAEDMARYTRGLEFLSGSANLLLGPVSLPELFSYLAGQVSEVAGGPIVIVNELDLDNGTTVIRDLYAEPEEKAAMERILGRNPVGLAFKFNEDFRSRVPAGELVTVAGGIHELSFNLLPEDLARRIEKELNIVDIYAMAIAPDRDFIGTVAILTREQGQLRNKQLIESVVTQAALAFKRERAHREALQEKNRLEAVMEALPVGVAILDERGGTLRANRSFNEIWGNPVPATRSVADYASYQAWWAETGKPVRPEEWAASIALRDGATVTGQTMRIERFDGDAAYVFNSAAPIYNADGSINGCAVAIQDISRRMEAEQALRESEERFRLALKNAPVSIATQDRDLRFTYAYNQHTQRPEDVIGKTDTDLFPEDAAHLVELKRRVIETGVETRESIWLTSNDQRLYLDVCIEPIRDDSGVITGIGIATVDLTAMKTVEEALRESEERARRQLEEIEQIYHNAPVGLCVVDTGLRWVRINELLARANGHAVEEHLGKIMRDLVPEMADIMEPHIRRVIETGRPIINAEIEAEIAPGDRKYWTASWLPLVDDRGAVTGVNTVIMDITPIRTAEKALQRSLQRFALLAETASGLLQTNDPQALIETLCRKVMELLDCHAFFNFMADHRAGRLYLNAYAGIPDEDAALIRWLDYGVAVCGCAARDRCRIVAEHIPSTPDVRTELIKSYGIKAYACHPIMGEDDTVIGTLSFGTRSRETYGEEDLALMKAITDQVAAAMVRMKKEEAQRDSEARYRSLMELSPTAIFVNRGDRIVMLNTAALELFGVSGSVQVLGKSPLELFHPDSHVMVMERIRNLREGRNVPVLEERIVRKDGSERHVEVSAAAIVDAEGPAIQVVLHDITGRKKLEEQIRLDLAFNAAMADLSEALISPDLAIHEITLNVFRHATALTGSPHGFVTIINQESHECVAYHLTDMNPDCGIDGAGATLSFPQGPGGNYEGLWGHCLNTREPVLTNDPGTHPSAKGTPPGHVPLTRFLSTPAVLGDTVLGNIAVANATRDYDDRDLETLKRIANLFAMAIMRSKYETELEEANVSLERRVRERSMQLYRINSQLLLEIEEKKKAEEALRKSELKFRTVADFTYAGEYWIDARGDYVYVSPSYERITGYRPDEFMMDRDLLANIVHRDDRGKFADHSLLESHDMEPLEFDFRIIRKDGTVRNIAHVCAPVYGDTGEFIGRRATNRDVTEQRVAELRLREGQEVASALINTPSEPVLLTASDGTIIDANDEFVKRLGRRRQDVIGASLFDMIYPDMAALRREKIDQVLESGTALRFDEKSGDNWYDTIIYPVRGRQGLVTKLAIFSHDVTEKRRMQRDILEISELERQRIGQDLHDSLGQKLTGIAFLAEALRQTMQGKSYPELADIEEIIFNVTDSIDHARKISSGLWTERFSSYDAARALEELAGDTQGLFRINCSFNSEIDEEVANRTAVTNLYFIARESVNNAIKHGRADRIEITLYDDDTYIYLKIQDNGRGPHANYDKKRGLGLRIMQYRAGILGGTVHTLAASNGFTVVAAVKKEFIRNYLH